MPPDKKTRKQKQKKPKSNSGSADLNKNAAFLEGGVFVWPMA